MISTVPSNYPKIANRRGGQTLRRAISSFDRGRISADDLAATADDVTVEVIAEQERAGIDIITDGQIRWQDPVTYIAGGLHGFEIGGLIRYFDTNTHSIASRARRRALRGGSPSSCATLSLPATTPRVRSSP